MDERIGVFDSGLGGISVLAQMLITLPQEKFIYFGDSKNAPYGEKTKKDVLNFSMHISEYLIERDCKALVVACNTATSAAIKELRKIYSLPIIGMEPAVKPAVNMENIQRVVVMATPFTLKEKKFYELVQNIGTSKQIIELPCPGLVQIIEQEGGAGAKVKRYLNKLFQRVPLDQGDVLVLGCTHYVFLTEIIEEILNHRVPMIHGNVGTVLELKNQLKDHHMLSKENKKKIFSSTDNANITITKNVPLQERVLLINSHSNKQVEKMGWNLLQYELEKLRKQNDVL
jgi:glutamate racemase